MMLEKAKDAVELKAGLSVDIIVNLDMVNERTDVRRSVIYDIEEGSRIILSQTTPSLNRFHLGKDMDITFLHRGKDELTRFGIIAKVTDIIKSYKLYSNETVPAVLMLKRPKRELLTYNLRMFHRVKPGPTSRIKLFMNNTEYPLIDISIGGLCFTRSMDVRAEVGKVIPARVEIDGAIFTADAKILRAWSPPELRKNNLEYVATQFVSNDKRLSFVLGGKVLEIEREQLNRGLE